MKHSKTILVAERSGNELNIQTHLPERTNRETSDA